MSSWNCRRRSVSMLLSSLRSVEEFRIDLTPRWGRAHDGRGVVMHHTPLLAGVLKHIRSEDTRHLQRIRGVTEILHAGDPGDPPIEVHRDVGYHETHVIRVGKNGLPTLANGFPATEQTPARMHTFRPLGLDPYSGHLADIQALKGAIKTLVGTFDLLNGLFLRCHSHLLHEETAQDLLLYAGLHI